MESSLHSEDIKLEVKKFISGTGRSFLASNSYEVTQASLNLLKNVPAVRESVLEHFCSVFSVATTKYLRQLEVRPQSVQEETIIVEIYTILNNFIKKNAEAWAPIILDWSLNLLGNLSSDYSKCIGLSVNTDIHDLIQYWMSCQATRTLIDITALCLQNHMHYIRESCINMLFNISIIHSPYFDWVVAHIGSCFPNILIDKIILHGLEDYYSFMNTDCKDKKKEVKLNSLVGILNYLSGSHYSIIKSAILDLFKISINENFVDMNRDIKVKTSATVPFLINLASHFPLALSILTNDILKILEPDIIYKLSIQSTEWKKYFNNDKTCLLYSLTKLTLICKQEAFQIIYILLDIILNENKIDDKDINICQSVKEVCFEILELILKEAEYTVRIDFFKAANMPFLLSIKQDLPDIMILLSDCQPLRVKTAMRLLSLLGIQNFNILVITATYILQKANMNFQLALLIRFVVDNSIYLAKKYKNDYISSNLGYFTQVIEQSIKEVQYPNTSDDNTICQLFQNLTILLKWENSGKIPCLESNFITQAIKANLMQMIIYLNQTHNFFLASSIIEMLNCLNISDSSFLLNVELILKLTKSVIHYFDMCIAENDLLKKKQGSKIVCDFLKKLIKYSQFAKVLALRETLEVTIFCEQAKYFGTREKCKSNVLEELLLQQNHKQGSGAILAQRHSSVFHAGIIGQGPRKLIVNNNLDAEVIQLNNTLLIDLIKACCSNYNFSQYPIDIDSITLVSLLLVELISPDVMYNGLPWPDEDFTKVTVERDLQIRRSFKDAPVLWTLLQLTAWYRPALAYCSVLLRAIIATILANCSIYKGTKITNVMALGQLLPPPLSTIINVIPVLMPYQVVMVLRECVWMYIHENIPSPMLFTRNECSYIAWRDTETSTPNKKFTETLRLLLLSNINTLGSLYATLFFDVNKNF